MARVRWLLTSETVQGRLVLHNICRQGVLKRKGRQPLSNSGKHAQLGILLNDVLKAALHGPRATTFERGLACLGRTVPFGGAWWGLIDSTTTDVQPIPPIHLNGSIGLDLDVRSEYFEVCGGDAFAVAVMACPEQVLCWSGSEDDASVELKAWAQRHELAHGAAIGRRETFSGQTFVLCLYRFEGTEPFSEVETSLIRFAIEQLLVIWSFCLKEAFQTTSSEFLSGTLLASPDGTLLFCGAKMASTLAENGWNRDGVSVPADWLALGDTGGRLRTECDWVVVARDQDGLRAELASCRNSPSLPTRHLRVALLFCDGLSAKQIARELGLSPATVRTYLRDTYNQLHIRNKAELHRVLRRFTSA